MNTNTRHDHEGAPPLNGFEDRLLTTILGDFESLTAAPSRASGARRKRTSRFAPSRLALSATAAAGVAAIAIAVVGTADLGGANTVAGAGAGAAPAVASAKTLAVYKLASASAAAPALTGRYFVLRETDNETGQDGPSQRISVINAETGASVTYQQAAAGSNIPGRLTEGPDTTSTEAWYQALPTDPTALRAKLLSISQQQQQQADQAMAQQATEVLAKNPGLAGKLGTRLTQKQPQLSDDVLVYQEANLLLWSPLVQPQLRAALYRVIANTGGYSLNSSATDPSGRPAVAMTNTSTVGGAHETDVIYEDPSTGAVLAQVWKIGSETLTSVYQPVTTSNTCPPTHTATEAGAQDTDCEQTCRPVSNRRGDRFMIGFRRFAVSLSAHAYSSQKHANSDRFEVPDTAPLAQSVEDATSRLSAAVETPVHALRSQPRRARSRPVIAASALSDQINDRVNHAQVDLKRARRRRRFWLFIRVGIGSPVTRS